MFVLGSLFELMKEINISYGNWLSSITTVILILLSYKYMKEDILTRVYSGRPFLRLENCKDNKPKKADVTLTVHLPNKDSQTVDQECFSMQLVNYGNGPAVNVCIEAFGTILKIIEKGDKSEIVPDENLLESAMMVDFINSWGRDGAIRPGDTYFVNFITVIHEDIEAKEHSSIFKFTDVNKSILLNKRYYLEFSYRSLSDKKLYRSLSIFEFVVVYWNNGEKTIGTKIEETYNSLSSNKKHRWNLKHAGDEQN